jgi:hypothetical protein
MTSLPRCCLMTYMVYPAVSVCGGAVRLIGARKDPAGGGGRVSNACLENFSPMNVTGLQGHR